MEFPFDVGAILPVDEKDICMLHGRTLKGNYMVNVMSSRHGAASNPISALIDVMGKLSAKAQKLNSTITTFQKFAGTDHRLYIKIQEGRVMGFLKTGEKNLFYRDMVGEIREINPVCVLDFYVHESCQRSGYGKVLF